MCLCRTLGINKGENRDALLEIFVFDSVKFDLEDYVTLRLVYSLAEFPRGTYVGYDARGGH